MRDWLQLPPEITTMIFQKLGVVDTLERAQWVCSEWERLSHEPHLWCSIHLPREWNTYRMREIAVEAVHRSRGLLEDFFIEDCATDELLDYVTTWSMDMKRLRMAYCNGVSDDGLINMAYRLPDLEEVELRRFPFGTEVIAAFGEECPRLKSFRIDYPEGDESSDEYALAIAKNMPHLRHLCLFFYGLSKHGLRAILDGCPHLESLNLLQIYLLTDDDDLYKRCVDAGITILGGSDDSTKTILKKKKKILKKKKKKKTGNLAALFPT